MRIKVLRAGFLTTIQDLGRLGYQKYGVVVSGAMDPYALQLANILVGNRPGEGGLEITMLGPELLFEQDVVIALTGGDLSPQINGRAAPMRRPVWARAGCVLRFGGCAAGGRAYLSVAGGFDVPMVMGSKSTYLRAGIGGLAGRALKDGDILPVGAAAPGWRESGLAERAAEDGAFAAPAWFMGRDYAPRTGTAVARVVEGRQFAAFEEESQTAFLTEPFAVTDRSDRMGYRLSGAKLKLKTPRDLISEAVDFGAIQAPPDGDPIILLADRQTVGGYAKIAQIARVDLPVVAQTLPGCSIRFERISLPEAEAKYIAEMQSLREMAAAVRAHLLKRDGNEA